MEPAPGPPQTPDQWESYFALRWQILRAPWGAPRGSERDELEDASDHALLLDDAGRPAAVGRLHFNSPHEAQIRYMATAEHARGQGRGRRIVAYLEALARRRGAAAVVLNARDEAVGFYEKLGYASIGAGPTLFGAVTHRLMRKQLDPADPP